MKKFLSVLIVFLFCITSVKANDTESLPYKDLSIKSKVSVAEDGNWSEKVNKKSDYYLIKGGIIYTKDDNIVYETDSNYLFIKSGRLIGYSDFKFYEYSANEDKISKRELFADEISDIFKEFKVIKLSEFSAQTHAYKFKKHGSETVMIINDTSVNTDGYGFTTNNSRFINYPIDNTIKITKNGIIELSCLNGFFKGMPVYVLLVR